MARPAARKRDYLFTRGASAIWHIKLQGPDKRIERSLGTTDKTTAEIMALPMIADHKRALQAARPQFASVWERDYDPGKHPGPDGGEIIASPDQLQHYDASGTYLRSEPNGRMVHRKVSGGDVPFGPMSRTGATTVARLRPVISALDRPVLAVKNSDDDLFEYYLKKADKGKGVHGSKRREAETVWALFRSLTKGKPLKDCTRKDDVAKLIQHFADAGNSTGTIRKKLVWLCAAVNLAIENGDLSSNPFHNAAPKVVEMERKRLDESDIAACKANLGKLSASDQVLFRLLACSGMRLGEAATIKSEEPSEKGIRYVRVGTKNENSLRNVPLPADVLEFLPAKIAGPLFKADGASKRLNKFLRDCGITDEAKVIHSLRHRAANRLLNAKCPPDIREVLLGHRKSIAGKYAGNYPIADLKQWVDVIGF